MKKILVTFCGLTSLSLAKLPEEITATVAETTIMIGEVLATHGSNDGADFSAFVKKLVGLGFGQSPLDPPPWYKAEIEGEDEAKRKDREGEMKTRLKTRGASELTFLTSLDLDKDLKLTKEEVNTSLTTQLEKILQSRLAVDRNGDTKLSLKEYALIVPARGEISPEDGVDWHQRGHFKDDDRNEDGLIDQSEMLGHEVRGFLKVALRIKAVYRFASLDTDKDGILTKSEHPKLWAELLPLPQVYPAIYWFSPEKLKDLQ
ncbi:MAG: Ca2+-binding EF-hand superfamily protein [Akkermansiaceae bacterium]|jgi:hypothetical protein